MTKAIIFTHLTVPREVQPIEFPRNHPKILRYFKRRIQTYNNCNAVGLVYLFIAEGYQTILGADRPWEGLDKERILRNLLEEVIDEQAANKVQIIGNRELIPIMARFSRAAEGELGPLLLGHGKNMYYDSPKIVEAIIRLARPTVFGNEPIFRFDADVEIDCDNLTRLLHFYDQVCGEKFYFFSGGYRCHTVSNKDRLLNGYAVRVAQFCQKHNGRYVLDEKMAKQFLDDLKDIGADPHTQVISGAGLCMSVEAIRILPPFANVGDMIIWIDDHLKCALHEALGHFGNQNAKSHRCEDAAFVQNRYPHGLRGGAISWHANNYLERLSLGCIIDGLVRQHKDGGIGVFSEHVKALLHRWVLLNKMDFERDLSESARRCLDEVRKTWEEKYKGTAVEAFAKDQLLTIRQGHGLESPIVRRVIDDLYAYLQLLREWVQFSTLCTRLNPRAKDSQWLFRDP